MSAKVTLSIELELGWGSHINSSYERYSYRRKKESTYLRKLIQLCDKENIPITFNVVGKLLSDTSSQKYKKEYYPNGWWEDYEAADDDLMQLFYAPELIQTIIESDVDHEFATHTLSHIMIDEVSSECLEYELKQVADIYNEWGINQPTSFVAPRHRQFDPNVLINNNLRTVRVPDHNQSSPNVGISAWMLYRTHPVRDPEIEDGILKTYSSSYPSLTYSGVLPKGQLEPDTQFQYLPLRLRQRLQDRYLKNAVKRARKQDSHAHLWTHLWDMANEEQWTPIENFIKWLGEESTTDAVDILRMQDLNKKSMEG
jgi:hypothetical protein